LKVVAGDAVILFAHGARDVRWAAPLGELAQAIRARADGCSVRTAFLELQSPRLLEALEAAASEGTRRIHVVPVFWAAAGHVDNELPPIIAEFTARHPQIVVRTLPVLSRLPGMMDFIARAIADTLAPDPSATSGRGEKNS
jgi:sirohydrochlorin cobaltochelatase